MQFWVTLERISMPFVLNQGSLKADWSCYMLNGSWQFESTYDFFDFSIADDYLQNWNNKYLMYAAEGSERECEVLFMWERHFYLLIFRVFFPLFLFLIGFNNCVLLSQALCNSLNFIKLHVTSLTVCLHTYHITCCKGIVMHVDAESLISWTLWKKLLLTKNIHVNIYISWMCSNS